MSKGLLWNRSHDFDGFTAQVNNDDKGLVTSYDILIGAGGKYEVYYSHYDGPKEMRHIATEDTMEMAAFKALEDYNA